MLARFLGLAGPCDAIASMLATLGPFPPLNLEPVFASDRVRVFAPSGTPAVPLAPGRGIVIGSLFERDDRCTAVADLSRSSAAIAASSGASLLRDFWGSYVAFVDGDPSFVLRDPSGALPAYRLLRNGVEIFVSDVSLARAVMGARLDLDEVFLRHWLGFPFLRTACTGLVGVSELLPGERAPLGRAVERAWDPWDYAGGRHSVPKADEAATMVGDVTRACVSALTRAATRPMLELSGGLDSSIIAASLAAAGRPFTSANLVTGSPDGDERRFARAVATRTASTLSEIEADPTAAIFTPSSLRFRPGLDPLLRNIDAAFLQHARETGADLILSGAGGDNVFCYLASAAPILDAWRSAGPRTALAAVHDVAQLAGVPFWTAVGSAIHRARRKRRPAWRRDTDFLVHGVAPDAPEFHPWLEAPATALPGKREQIEAIVRIQHFLDTFERWHVLPMTYPLLSQPIIEACLRVPSWLWCAGGRNRAVARDAFADLLPANVIQRRTKGRLEAFALTALAHHRRMLRSIILEGSLARDGYVDRAAAEGYLRGDADPPDYRYFRLFEIANLELWRQDWRAAGAAPPRPATA